MGKEARAKQARPPAPTGVRLERGDYFELKALVAGLQNAQLEAEAVKHKIAAAQAQAQAKLTALALTHGFDATQNFRLDDATTSLIPQ